MITLKIYIADDGDTLRTISRKNGAELEDLLSLNPHIARPDLVITGNQVKLPDASTSTRDRTPVPSCPPPKLTYQEQWIPLTTLEQMERTYYDVLVVGTGAGGGAALWRLVQQLQNSGKRIGIIERGGLLIPTHAQNIATLDFESRNSYFNSVAVRRTDFATQFVYALGGRTLFWTATSPRMSLADMAGWPITVQEMDNYYNIAEKAMNVTQSFTEGASITQILLDRLQQNGFPESIDEPIAMNLQPTSRFGVINSNVFYSSLVLFAQALNGAYDLAVNARAVQVLTDKDRVAGVKVMSPDKKSYYLKARNVVLSASTLGTAQILLNSDIQGRAIGHYLSTHSRITGAGMVNRSEFPEVLGPLRILIPGTGDRPYQIQILGPGPYRYVQYEIQPLQAEWGVTFAASGKVESRYDNKVTLDPLKRDEYGVPEIQIDFSYSEQDRAVIQQMGDAVKRASSAMGVPLIERDGQPFCLVPPGQEVHEMGTCRMGDDPISSATNRYGQIHGMRGLYVADNSVIPTSGTASPTLTTAALAIRTADYIVQQLK
ncbi:GMC oxidoreductase [Paenibacillus alkaliterrae]|uniref:GMC oxidoreductase n=1 Tax=Paenibacillus alkaliterrae TaxID=320909 RepID=UPI001F26FA8C|nr:GMC oxidoreductase [Paenibacillus alkaliterrae]MCF2937952.1 GMC oxidoreductase [Paenibacillus alkaliterrae]